LKGNLRAQLFYERSQTQIDWASKKPKSGKGVVSILKDFLPFAEKLDAFSAARACPKSPPLDALLGRTAPSSRANATKGGPILNSEAVHSLHFFLAFLILERDGIKGHIVRSIFFGTNGCGEEVAHVVNMARPEDTFVGKLFTRWHINSRAKMKQTLKAFHLLFFRQIFATLTCRTVSLSDLVRPVTVHFKQLGLTRWKKSGGLIPTESENYWFNLQVFLSTPSEPS